MDSVGAVCDYATLSTSELATERTSTDAVIGYPIYRKDYARNDSGNNYSQTERYSLLIAEQSEFATPKKPITTRNLEYNKCISDLNSNAHMASKTSFQTPKRVIRPKLVPLRLEEPRKPKVSTRSAREDFDMERAIAAIPSITEEDTIESYFE